MNIKEIAEKLNVDEIKVSNVLTAMGLTADQVNDSMLKEIGAAAIGGGLAMSNVAIAPKPVNKPLGFGVKKPEPIEPTQAPTQATDRKAALQAQIQELKEQAEMDELEEQLLELKAQQAQKAREITMLRETVLDSEEALVGQRAAIEFREKKSQDVLALTKSVAITGSQGQFDKTIAALNRSLEIVTDMPVEAEIALGQMGKRRSAMKNRMMLIANSTESEVPQMSMCAATEGVMKTVTIDA